jgi:ATPase family associated with various cellular activities (AAA)
MSETFVLDDGPRDASPVWAVPQATAPPTAGERLQFAVMRMAGRLGALLAKLDTASREAAFLGTLATQAGQGGMDGSVLDLPAAATVQPIDRVAARLGLDSLDLDLLVLAGLPGEREELAAILRNLHPGHLSAATGGLAAALAEAGLLGDGLASDSPARRREAARERLTSGQLGRSGLVRLDRAAPFAEAAIVPGPAVWEALRGEDLWPPACRPWSAPVTTDGLGRWSRTGAPQAVKEAFRRLEPIVAVAIHERPPAAAGRIAGLAELAGRSARIVRNADVSPGWIALVALHALIRGVIPVVVLDGADHFDADLDAVPWPVAACLPEGGSIRSWPRPLIEIPYVSLEREDRLSALEAAFPELQQPSRPAGPATAEPADIVEAATNLRAASRLTGGSYQAHDVGHVLERTGASPPPEGAVVVRPMATFDDLVVSPDVMSQLLEATARLEHREVVLERWGFLAGRPGREGLRLLFYGPPGTGKTLAGEVLAGALGRDLLVIDLSRIVSKWVGETEKQLAATFESAERTGSALMFDEADALFGRRTEVGDARDRYANLETAYLLSRIERFEGLVVLATNLRQNLDGAFARRLDFIVGFDPPDVAQRAQLWRRLLPPDAPLDPAVDLDQLAALYAITGGLIRSAAVSAGYLAAADGAVITTDHLVHAIRREYAKAGQHFPGEPHRNPHGTSATRSPTAKDDQ